MKNQTVIINDTTLRDGEQTAGVPETEVGREHRLVLGKHSGSISVIEAYADLKRFHLDSAPCSTAQA